MSVGADIIEFMGRTKSLHNLLARVTVGNTPSIFILLTDTRFVSEAI